MENLLHLQDKILRTSQALGRLESEVAVHPNSRTIQSNILSLRKLHHNLQHDFDIAARDLGLDVCHYRMLEARPPAKALSSVIGTFQDALSLTYDALKTGPKIRRILNPAAIEDTELRVAYSYPGSFGMVFTLANEQLMFPDMRTLLDVAVEKVFDLGKAADNAAIISKTVQEVGRAPIVAIHDWAKANTQYKTGAAIEWRKNESEKSEVLIQLPEFSLLFESLERIRNTKDTEVTESGVLVGADVKSHRFHFVIDGTFEDIRGSFKDAISESQQRTVPFRYLAHLHKTTETSYATDEEKTSYFLLGLENT